MARPGQHWPHQPTGGYVLFRDDSKRRGKIDDKIGHGFGTRFTVLDRVDEDGIPVVLHPGALMEPDAFRRDDLREVRADRAAVFMAPQMIADRENPFGPPPDFDTAVNEKDAPCDTKPARYSAGNRSTRVCDQFPELLGKPDEDRGEALITSSVCVVDNMDPAFPFSCATVIGPRLHAGGSAFNLPFPTSASTGANLAAAAKGGADLLTSGYNYDGDAAGLWWTVLTNSNPNDEVGAGARGTSIRITGIRSDAHFESSLDRHGAIHFDPDFSLADVPDGDVGILFKASMAHDSTIANTRTQIDHESVKWRPWFRMVYFFPTDGPPSGPPPTDPPPDPIEPGQPTTPRTPVALVIPGNDWVTSPTPALTNIQNADVQGHLAFVVEAGPAADRTIAYVSQGGAGAEFWGMTLPGTTQVGVDHTHATGSTIQFSATTLVHTIARQDSAGDFLIRHLTGGGAFDSARVMRLDSANVMIGQSAATPLLSFGSFGPTLRQSGVASALDLDLGLRVGTSGAIFEWDPFLATGTANGAFRVTGKLTVDGGIDPVYMEFDDGSTQAASAAQKARMRYVHARRVLQLSVDGGAYYDLAGASGPALSRELDELRSRLASLESRFNAA